MAVVEDESLSSWKWFLETLKEHLKIGNTFPWTIIQTSKRVSFQLCRRCSLNQNTGFVLVIYTQIFKKYSKVKSSKINYGPVQDLPQRQLGIFRWKR
ncbi:unnamed protein product [Urochloa humidicola]